MPTPKSTTNKNAVPSTFTVSESKTEFVQAARGRAAAPNPLLPSVETAMQNRGKSYDVKAGSEATVKTIVNLLRRASETHNISIRIQAAPDNSFVKFQVREGGRIKRTRKAKTPAAS